MRKSLAVLLALSLVGLASCAFATERGSLSHGDRERTYLVHLPPEGVSTEGKPLLVVLHGGGGRGRGMITLTRGAFDARADRAGWVVVYPDGVEHQWNDGREDVDSYAHRANVDDVGFIASLVDVLVAKHGLDRKRVYVTGASNGGMMTYRLATETPERFAAAAPVMAAMPAILASRAAPRTRIPLLAISGTEDPLVPWAGGQVHVLRKNRGLVLSGPATIRHWARWNGCSLDPATTLLEDEDPEDGTRVRREDYAPREGGAPVTFYVVEGGGHGWPGGRGYLPEAMIGRTSRDLDACAVIWDFFERQSRQ